MSNELETDDRLTQTDGETLLCIARCSLRAYLDGEKVPDAEAIFGGDPPPELCCRRGAFVTWQKAGALRGCIGYVAPRGTLWKQVRDLARIAATRDSRFSPIAAEEWPELTVSVSVLTPPQPLDPADVEVGRHGLIIERGARRGLLLPQVATDWKWDRETFLQHTCKKAGLPPDAWTDPESRLEGFEAQVFKESGAARS